MIAQVTDAIAGAGAPLDRDGAAALIAAAVDATAPSGSVVGLEQLARCLVRLGDRVGHSAHRPVRTVACTIRAWLGHVGVARDDGHVPAELVLWLAWADGLRCRDDAPRQHRVPAAWRILAVDDALGARMAMQRRGAPAGAWLPLVANHYGDHHVFVVERNAVAVQSRDELAPPAHTATRLLDYASALLAAWA